jgi:putative isomerase
MDFSLLKDSAKGLGKPEWRPVLEHVADLHGKSVFPPKGKLPYEWENIGPGYCYGPAFGHWDLFHAILDSIPVMPEHARRQILNTLAMQQEDGLIPFLWMKEAEPKFSKDHGYPPVWVFAVDDYCAITGSGELSRFALPHLLRQIDWFERKRKAQPEGFLYMDIVTNDNVWESGFDEGVRYIGVKGVTFACVDACSHVYALYDCAARWQCAAGQDSSIMKGKGSALKKFIQTRLFSEESGFFHDTWSVDDKAKRHFCFEGFWPMICGAATKAQADRLIDESVLNPERFLTPHPVPVVAICDPLHELRMLRGPAWNSMTNWLARGCMRYGRRDAARIILEKALDATSIQFERTGDVWEFYHPGLGPQTAIQRKPDTEFNIPCRKYLGHNPLFAMARLWSECQASA